MSKRAQADESARPLRDVLNVANIPPEMRDNLFGTLPDEILAEKILDTEMAQQLVLQPPIKLLAIFARRHMVRFFTDMVAAGIARVRAWGAQTSAFLDAFIAPLYRVTRLGALPQPVLGFADRFETPERRIPIAWVVRNAPVAGAALDERDWDALLAATGPSARVAELVQLVRARDAAADTHLEIVLRTIELVLDSDRGAQLSDDAVTRFLTAVQVAWSAGPGDARRGGVNSSTEDDDGPGTDEDAALKRAEKRVEARAAAAYWLTYLSIAVAAVQRPPAPNGVFATLQTTLLNLRLAALLSLWSESADAAAAGSLTSITRFFLGVSHWVGSRPGQVAYVNMRLDEYHSQSTRDFIMKNPRRLQWETTNVDPFEDGMAYLFSWIWEYAGEDNVAPDARTAPTAPTMFRLVALFETSQRLLHAFSALELFRHVLTHVPKKQRSAFVSEFLLQIIGVDRQYFVRRELQTLMWLSNLLSVADLLSDRDLRGVPLIADRVEELLVDPLFRPRFMGLLEEVSGEGALSAAQVERFADLFNFSL